MSRSWWIIYALAKYDVEILILDCQADGDQTYDGGISESTTHEAHGQ